MPGETSDAGSALAVAQQSPSQLATPIEDVAYMPLSAIKARLLAVTQMFADKEVMRPGIDYGLIPGCGNKPALFKSGAERICMLLRLAPTITFTRRDLPNDHREYEAVCSLVHIPTGAIWGQGVGSASTMESKHRWRKGEPEFTDRPAPRGYYDLKDRDWKAASKAIGGRGFSVRKHPDTKRFMIVKDSDERVENTDPADQHNTVLKMSKKRAYVDVSLTVSGMSGLLTQTMDDIKAYLADVPEANEKEIADASYAAVMDATKKAQNAAQGASRPAQQAQPPQDTPEDQDKLLAQLQAQLVKIAGALEPDTANAALRSAGIMAGVEQIAKIPSIEVIRLGIQACNKARDSGGPPPATDEEQPPRDALWGEPGGP